MVAIAAVPDLIVAFLASNYALYYVLLLLFIPLALLRAWITVEAVALAWGKPRPARRVWAMELVHSLVVIAALHSLQWNIVARTFWPSSPRAMGMAPYDNGAWAWMLEVIWPCAAILLALGALVAEGRSEPARRSGVPERLPIPETTRSPYP
jgi:hypothetical protein